MARVVGVVGYLLDMLMMVHIVMHIVTLLCYLMS